MEIYDYTGLRDILSIFNRRWRPPKGTAAKIRALFKGHTRARSRSGGTADVKAGLAKANGGKGDGKSALLAAYEKKGDGDEIQTDGAQRRTTRRARGRGGGGDLDDVSESGVSRLSDGTAGGRGGGGFGGVSAALKAEIKSIAETQRKLQVDTASTHMRLEAKIDQSAAAIEQLTNLVKLKWGTSGAK